MPATLRTAVPAISLACSRSALACGQGAASRHDTQTIRHTSGNNSIIQSKACQEMKCTNVAFPLAWKVSLLTSLLDDQLIQRIYYIS